MRVHLINYDQWTVALIEQLTVDELVDAVAKGLLEHKAKGGRYFSVADEEERRARRRAYLKQYRSSPEAHAKDRAYKAKKRGVKGADIKSVSAHSAT